MTAALALARRPNAATGPLARLGHAALRLAADRLWPDRGCCFIFHRAVGPAQWRDKPNRGFHLDLAFLERLIRHLQRTGWSVVTMSEACRRTAEPGGGRFVNFSVDDCYRDTAECVAPLFRRLGVPVTLYVTTGIPDGTLPLRNAGLESVIERHDAVADGERRYTLGSAAARRAAFAAISRAWDADPDPDERYRRFCAAHRESADALDAEHRLDWPTLAALARQDHVEIGAHSVTHRHVAALSADQAWAEIAGSRERLEAELGLPVRHFAFPYGQPADCGPRDFDLARRAGFASAATTVKGLVPPGADPHCLPRNTLNGEHRRLALPWLHLAGVSGSLTRLRRRD